MFLIFAFIEAHEGIKRDRGDDKCPQQKSRPLDHQDAPSHIDMFYS